MLRQTFRRARIRPLPSSSTSSFRPPPSPSLRRCQTTVRPFSSSSPDHRSPLPQSYSHDELLRDKTILIANRGEIAIRIARAARALGARSLAVCAPEDAGSPHVAFADDHVMLEGGETAIAPYLDIEGLTRAAVKTR